VQIIADAIDAAERGHTEEFQRFLFLMGMAAAHELVHAFVGFLTGDSGTNTPGAADFPRPGGPQTSGESGNYFEGTLTGFIVQAYYSPGSPLGNRQAGELLGMARTRTGTGLFQLDRNWMLARLSLGTPFFLLLSLLSNFMKVRE
jgi:hypothetical protein